MNYLYYIYFIIICYVRFYCYSSHDSSNCDIFIVVIFMLLDTSIIFSPLPAPARAATAQSRTSENLLFVCHRSFIEQLFNNVFFRSNYRSHHVIQTCIVILLSCTRIKLWSFSFVLFPSNSGVSLLCHQVRFAFSNNYLVHRVTCVVSCKGGKKSSISVAGKTHIR